MSRSVDERVVEMRFDNKQFESGAKQTLTTLQKLKQALGLLDNSKSLDGLASSVKDVNLDGIASGVEALEKRFSTMGIVGMRVIQNLTDSFMNFASRGINYVNDAIVSGGIRRAMNLENAHFQLQALLKDETKVQEIMANANKAVDGTAYSYDEAAKAASQFAASGIEAGDAMVDALRGIVGVSAMTNSEFEYISQIFTTVAGNGRLMGDQLLQLSGRGLNAASTIADFVNGVTDGSKQASSEVTAAVKAISNGAKVTEGDIRDLVSKGKISFGIFSEAMTEAFADSAERANETFTGALSNIRAALARIGAGFVSPLIEQNSDVIKLFNAVRLKINDVKKALVFDKELGNVNALSKQFTDMVLNMAKAATNFVSNADMTKPMEVFYYWVESVKNVTKGLLSVLSPIGKAFKEVFLSFSADDVISFSAAIEKLTSKLKLSEKGSKNLHDAFKGLFSVINLLVTIFFKLLGAILPIEQPLNSMGDGVLGLAGALGRALTMFTSWIRSSEKLARAFDVIKSAIAGTMGALARFISSIDDFAIAVYRMPITQKLLTALINAFKALGNVAAPYVGALINKIKELRDNLMEIVPQKAEEMFTRFVNKLNEIADALNEIDLTKPEEAFKAFLKVLDEMLKSLAGNKGISTFVTNMKVFFNELRKAFTFDTIIGNIKSLQDAVTGFVNWIKNTAGPLFKDFSLGGILSGGAGIGVVYSLIKMTKAFEKLVGTVKAIPDFLGGIKGVLTAYQKDLKASAIVKIAGAIALLAGALVLLSFADLGRVALAAGTLSALSLALSKAIANLSEAIHKGDNVNRAVVKFASGLKSAVKKLGRALEIKSVGSMVKDFGIAITMIAGSMIAIALMYKNDKEALTESAKIIGIIGASLAGLMAACALLSNKMSKGMSAFQKAGSAVLMLSVSLGIVVTALNKLFKMELPADWGVKVGILAGIFAGLGVLSIALSKVSSKIGEGGGKIQNGPVIALAASLFLVVTALNKLFKMELPADWGVKVGILAGIFAALAGLTIAVGYAGKLAGGALKATASILAMCVFVGVAVAALMVLSIMPSEKLLKGAVGLGLVLVALGAALTGAGKVTNKEAWKSVVAMAGIVGVITASLGVLSMIPITKLAKAGAALGAMLYLLAKDFQAIGKINNNNSWKSVAAMVASVVVIASSLTILAAQPWDSLLAAGAAMSAVITSFTLAFQTISKASGINLEKILEFTMVTLAVVPIGVALYELSKQPWENLIAAGSALSATVTSFSIAFSLISLAKPNLAGIAAFLAGTAGIALIAYSLYELASQPWDSLLAAGASLSLTITAMTAAMLLCTAAGAVAPAALAGIGLLDLFIINLGLVLAGLGALTRIDGFQELIAGGSGVLGQMGLALGNFVGNIIGGALSGVTSALPKMAQDLSGFMTEVKPFVEGAKNIDESAMKGIRYLAEAVLILTAANVINGLTAWFTGGSSLVQFGKELAEFGPYFKKYADSVAGLDPTVVEASSNAALALAEMAKKLPKSGGLADKLFGTSSLTDFGIELASFGPHLKKYADSVAGLDPTVVEASASAAQIMSDMAKKLPNSGGLAAKILGDNKLSDFGLELETFGPHFAKYADSVAGINPDIVTTSAAAAQALSELANGLPNSGGLVSFFTGDNDIGVFGASLAEFGSALSSYYVSVSGIDMGTLDAVIEEVKKLIALAEGTQAVDGSSLVVFAENFKMMGNMGVTSFVSAFTDANGQVTIAIQNMMSYAVTALQNGTSNIQPAAMSIGQTLCVSLQTGISSNQGAVILAITTLATAMNLALVAMLPASKFNDVGQKAINGLILGINAKRSLAISTIRNLGTALIQQMRTSLPSQTFNTIGQNIIQALINGMNSKRGLLLSTVSNICSAVISTFRSNLPANALYSIGSSLIEGLANGMNSAKGSVEAAARNAANAAISAARNGMSYDTFYAIGQQAGNGLRDGITSKIDEIGEAAAKAAAKAVSSAKNALQVHSPSRVFYQIGEYTIQGMVNGILQNINKVSYAGNEIAENVVNPVKEMFNIIMDYINSDDFDITPTITPVVDLSDVRRGAKEVYSLFDQNAKYNLQDLRDRVMSASSSFADKKGPDQIKESTDNKPVVQNIYNMEQNNYSPKALQRADIYRQTKNLFSEVKGIVENKPS